MNDRTVLRTVSRLAPVLCLASSLLLIGCNEPETPPTYAARIGDRYLLEDDVQRMLENVPAGQDTADARRQIIDQWISTEVLYQEAVRRGLQEDPDVRRRLRESERSVLVNSLIARIYEENNAAPSAAEMQSYFERHRDQLRLRESFVRVRYVETDTRARAEEVRRAMQQAPRAARDSIWSQTVDRLGLEGSQAREISSNYHPESRLFAGKPPLYQALTTLSDGQTAPIVETDSVFHVIQLAERVPPGTVPEPEWIKDELARRLIIQDRKQLYARQVQRLRNEALAREDLEIN